MAEDANLRRNRLALLRPYQPDFSPDGRFLQDYDGLTMRRWFRRKGKEEEGREEEAEASCRRRLNRTPRPPGIPEPRPRRIEPAEPLSRRPRKSAARRLLTRAAAEAEAAARTPAGFFAAGAGKCQEDAAPRGRSGRAAVRSVLTADSSLNSTASQAQPSAGHPRPLPEPESAAPPPEVPAEAAAPNSRRPRTWRTPGRFPKRVRRRGVFRAPAGTAEPDPGGLERRSGSAVPGAQGR